MFKLRRFEPQWLLVIMSVIILTVASVVPINGEAGDGFLRFIGRFHILVLHFPVTLLLLAPVLSIWATLTKNSTLKPFIKVLWWLGSFAVFFTVLMGMLLAANEGFTVDEIRQHMLGGLGVALLSFCATAIFVSSRIRTWHKTAYSTASTALVLGIFYAAHAGGNLVHGDTYLVRFAPEPMAIWFAPATKKVAVEVDDAVYNETVRPLFNQYCFGCHGADTQKGGVQLDVLSPDFINGNDAPHWHAALDMINTGQMPPAKKQQPNDEERRQMVEWLTDGINLAKETKKGKSQQVIRRLSKPQYENTLKDLMGIDVAFSEPLPTDPLSEIGFSNNAELLQNSRLHLETFEQIARTALSKAIGPEEKPDLVHYRMHFGNNIGIGQNHRQSGGYLSVPLKKQHFYVEVLDENGQPKADETLGDIKTYFSASLRGSDRHRFAVNEQGISLFSAKPHPEINQEGKLGSWHGPSPNLAMQVKKHFPMEGNFEITIKASRGESFTVPWSEARATDNVDPIIKLDKQHHPITNNKTSVVMVPANAETLNSLEQDTQDPRFFKLPDGALTGAARFQVNLSAKQPEYYEINLVHPELAMDETTTVKLKLGNRVKFAHHLTATGRAKEGQPVVSKLGIATLTGGNHQIRLTALKNFPGFSDLILTKITPNKNDTSVISDLYFVNEVNPDASPVVVPYIGSRTDDGMDYLALDDVSTVTTDNGESQVYRFSGRLENLPVPNPDAEGDQWISGSLKIGVWNGDMIVNTKDKGSVLNVEYIEFKAPIYEQWPSQPHRDIFIDSALDKTSPEYAKLVIQTFAERAFRRPVSADEIQPYFDFWLAIEEDFPRFEDSVKETLVAILSSTNFLYLAEPTEHMSQVEVAPQKPNRLFELLGISGLTASETSLQPISEYALASRLSYFLWNSPPDMELLNLAAQGRLKENVASQLDRMVQDSTKLKRFINVFAAEWLRVDLLKGQTVDMEKFPDFNRFVKQDMVNETTEFLSYLIQNDLSATNLIESDFAMLNQNLATFYGIHGVLGPEFRRVPLHSGTGRGGLLGQGAFLTGHADGVHSHPVKRAVWLKSKIMGVEPPPPPPNVPELDPDTPGFDQLTLKQQLELHRDKESCRDCHAKIDPYGIVFENYDAVGRYRAEYKGVAVDSVTILPDGISVEGMAEIKAYLMDNKSDQVALSLIKHLFAYALGKEVSFQDDDELDAILSKVKENGYSMQSVLLAIINSPSFKRG